MSDDDLDNEAWLLKAIVPIFQKESLQGVDALSVYDRLVHCLWVADYCMRNAGDLQNARALDSDFQIQGLRAARRLSLKAAQMLFELDEGEFEEQYFERFDKICDELRTAERGESV